MTVSGGDLAGLNGTVGLDLAGGQNITDVAGNALPAGEPATDETYLLDNTAPVLTAFARNTPATSPTNADTLVFDITFDEDVRQCDRPTTLPSRARRPRACWPVRAVLTR